jgi:uncharacterized protein (DUF1015 family)
MTNRIKPFSALTYNSSRVGLYDEVVAPPYDLIDKEQQEELYARSPFNVIRLELNRDSDPYASAAATLKSWRAEGILTSSARPALYHYTQVFEDHGRERKRTGIIARVKLEEFSSGRILPHERTFPKAKEDRLRLLEATGVNVSSIFGLYPSQDQRLGSLMQEVAMRPPVMTARDRLGISNEVRLIEQPEEIAVVQEALEAAQILIADGHHRYETALEYRRRRARENSSTAPQPFDYVMMTLVAFDDPGLVILPTHRIARRLPPEAIASFDEACRRDFEIKEFTGRERFLVELGRRGQGAVGVSLAKESKLRLLTLRPGANLSSLMADIPGAVRELDVSILHALIFEQIFGLKPEEIRAGGSLEYTIDAAYALSEVAAGAATGAFLMNAPTVDDIERVSTAGAVMPEKSTYFFPKLLTGLVMNPIED